MSSDESSEARFGVYVEALTGVQQHLRQRVGDTPSLAWGPLQLGSESLAASEHLALVADGAHCRSPKGTVVHDLLIGICL